MTIINKLTVALIALYFIVVVHIWFPNVGITGLGIQQNNITWLWLGVITGLVIYSLTSRTILKIPRFWLKGSLPLLLFLCPLLVVSTWDTFVYGLPALIGFLTAWLALVVFYQIDFIKEKPLLILAIVSFSGFIQAVWGLFEIVNLSIARITEANTLIKNSAEGVFNQRNVLSSYVATGLICAYLYVLWIDRDKVGTSKVLWIYILLYSTFTGVILYFNMSRSSIIGLLLGLLFLAPAMIRQKNKLCSLGSVMIFVGAGLAFYSAGIVGDIDKEVTSGGARVNQYYTSLMLIADSPVIGHGLGSFEKVFVDKFSYLYQNNELISSIASHGNYSHPHNEILFWGVQGGVVSVLGLILMCFILIKALRIKSFEDLMKLAVFTPIVVHSMFEMPFAQSSIHLILLALLFVTVLQVSSKSERFEVSKSFLPKHNSIFKIVSTGIITISTVVFGLNIYSLNKLNQFIYEGQNIEKISKIPVSIGWNYTFQYFYKATLFRNGSFAGSDYACNEYINWAVNTIEVSPKLDYYRNVIQAYDCIGDTKNFEKYLSELERLYPTHVDTQAWVRQYREQNRYD